jgi:hypothetical protein
MLAWMLADSPIGFYRLGEPSGATPTDTSSSANDRTCVNTSTLGWPARCPKTTSPGPALWDCRGRRAVDRAFTTDVQSARLPELMRELA